MWSFGAIFAATTTRRHNSTERELYLYQFKHFVKSCKKFELSNDIQYMFNREHIFLSIFYFFSSILHK